ncbi:MAG: hypothetical protein WC717_06465 [Candidatus Micrarchaeia archaeon]|jgi:hypothetical protein
MFACKYEGGHGGRRGKDAVRLNSELAYAAKQSLEDAHVKGKVADALWDARDGVFRCKSSVNNGVEIAPGIARSSGRFELFLECSHRGCEKNFNNRCHAEGIINLTDMMLEREDGY